MDNIVFIRWFWNIKRGGRKNYVEFYKWKVSKINIIINMICGVKNVGRL